MYKIRIEIVSFDYFYLEKSIKKFQEIFLSLGLNNIKHVGLPKNKKKFTLLRSPHIDKKSREQLEIKKYKIQILMNVNNSNSSIISVFLYILKNSKFFGVEIKITLFYLTQYKSII